MLLLKFIFRSVRSRIAAQPEIFDKSFALFVGGKLQEGFAFGVGNDVRHVIIQPNFVGRAQLVLQLLLLGFGDVPILGLGRRFLILVVLIGLGLSGSHRR